MKQPNAGFNLVIEPICDHPLDGSLETPGGLRLCCNPAHYTPAHAYAPVWHRVSEWPPAIPEKIERRVYNAVGGSTQPICDHPLDGSLETLGGLRLCTNPAHAGAAVWHRISEWPADEPKR